MILILTESTDGISNDVMAWLNHPSVLRINNDNKKQFFLEIDNDGIGVSVNNGDPIRVDYYWYRRGLIPLQIEDKLDQYVLSNLKEEHTTWILFLQYCFNQGRSLGSLEKELNNNKLIDLHLATKAGLLIPKTRLVQTRAQLENVILDSPANYITKPMSNSNLAGKGGRFEYINNGTVAITEESVSSRSDKFFPSLVQERIEKAYELRIFILEDALYAMAIFSQAKEETAIDYRHYSSNKPNRYVPYELPDEIRKKILAFMEYSNLDTGSIDLVVTPDDQFYFIEVNPSGQFKWLSNCCNYYIDKHIAQIINRTCHESN